MAPDALGSPETRSGSSTASKLPASPTVARVRPMQTGGQLTPRDGPRGEDPEAVLELAHISKSFGTTQALSDVSITVRGGEIHGLLGENGAGKSTLIGILGGFVDPDPGGTMRLRGREIPLPVEPSHHQRLGLSFVHQNLALANELTVSENFRVGGIARSEPKFIRRRRESKRVAETLAQYGVSLAPDRAVKSLAPSQRALLAVVRAFEEAKGAESSTGSPVIVLDEPTAFLGGADADMLFGLIKELGARGGAVVFVSHNLDEVMRHTHRVTVLRNGRLVGERVTAELSEGDMIEMIVGRSIDPPPSSPIVEPAARPAISVSGLSGVVLRDVSFDLRNGEILGIAGLLGSGADEIPYALFGTHPAASGRLHLPGAALDLERLTPARAMSVGVALVPADRAGDGAMSEATVTENVASGGLVDFVRLFLMRWRAAAAAAQALNESMHIVPRTPSATYGQLSGGNQQKVLFGKWLRRKPKLFLLHEPTQGVDIASRWDIHGVLRNIAGGGCGVLCISSDHEELAKLCDRVLIIARGRVVEILEGEAVTPHAITQACLRT